MDSKVYTFEEAFNLLKEGNNRFLNSGQLEKEHMLTRESLTEGQRPYATILTCSDSRVSPEILFDSNLGDLFIIRNAGNIASKSALGSIEYSVEYLNTPLILVLGHSNCGAVKASLTDIEYSEHLDTMVNKIKNSISGETEANEAGIKSIRNTINKISNNPVVRKNKSKVIGGYYELESGRVHFLE